MAKILKTDIGMGNNRTMDARLLPDEVESLLESGQTYRVAPFVNEQMILSYTSAHYCLRTPRQVVFQHAGHFFTKRNHTTLVELRFPNKRHPVLKIDIVHNETRGFTWA